MKSMPILFSYTWTHDCCNYTNNLEAAGGGGSWKAKPVIEL
jgi:hypothetical protein